MEASALSSRLLTTPPSSGSACSSPAPFFLHSDTGMWGCLVCLFEGFVYRLNRFAFALPVSSGILFAVFAAYSPPLLAVSSRFIQAGFLDAQEASRRSCAQAQLSRRVISGQADARSGSWSTVQSLHDHRSSVLRLFPFPG